MLRLRIYELLLILRIKVVVMDTKLRKELDYESTKVIQKTT